MYTFESRVRYSETGDCGRLTPEGIINYMQDSSTFHSQDCSLGIEHLEQEGKAWLLSSWQIVIDRYPRLGEDIVIGTWPSAFKGFYGYRSFVIQSREGESLVRANSIWFLLDLAKGIPARVLREDVEAYGPTEPALDLGEPIKKLHLPLDYETGVPVTICRHHLDSNHHVNNAHYVGMAAEQLRSGLLLKKIRVDYKKAALLGDQIIPRMSCREPGCWVAGLCSPQGEAYAVVQMETEMIK